jgi:hypothetical protein
MAINATAQRHRSCDELNAGHSFSAAHQYLHGHSWGVCAVKNLTSHRACLLEAGVDVRFADLPMVEGATATG